MQVMKAMPEFIGRNDIDPRAWTVEEGQAVRGDAWTDMRVAKMRVPFGADETSRVVRAHELMHAKVSPTNMDAIRAVPIPYEVIMSAEEFRVNMLIKAQGFDVDYLSDGSESFVGKLHGQNQDWNGIVRAMASMAGTKAGTAFLRGLKTEDPALEGKARAVQKMLAKEWRRATKARDGRVITKHVASTEMLGNQLPAGFSKFTLHIANLLHSLMIPETPEGTPDPHADTEIPDVENIVKNGAGRFAQLMELHVPKPKHVDGRLGRRRMASQVGKNPRRIERLLMDPDKRVFDRRARGRGGVVLIDQSGSMHLDESDIWSIIEHAPGCVIIGYSHATGRHSIPNVWVIADRGNVADKVPDGNGGNGVDGPAIRFATAKRRAGEPFIWVCDGHVTDGQSDESWQNLSEECASLVVKNGIHMAEDVAGAVEALKRAGRGERLAPKAVGPIERTTAWREHSNS